MAHLDLKTIKKNNKQINVTPFFIVSLNDPLLHVFFKVQFFKIGFTEEIVSRPASIVRELTPFVSRITIDCHQQ